MPPFLRRLSAIIIALLIAAVSRNAEAATVVVFDDFFDGGFIDDQASGTSVVDGITLTVNTVTTNSLFRQNSSGTGFDRVGIGAPDSGSNIDDIEAYSLSFDTAGTLDQVNLFLFPGTHNLVFTNLTSSDVATITANGLSSGQTLVTENVGLAFNAGDTINVNFGGSNTSALGYRLQEVQVSTATAVPEPSSVALLSVAAGFAGIVRRRRRTAQA